MEASGSGVELQRSPVSSSASPWSDTVTTLGIAACATVALCLGRLSQESAVLVLIALAAPTDGISAWIQRRRESRKP